MRKHVAVGVAGETARRVDPDAAEDERHALGKRMRVDPQPDADVVQPSDSCLRSRRSKTVTVS